MLKLAPFCMSITRSSKRRFKYYEDQHADLRNQIGILEETGFISNATVKETPIFRMTEGFVSLLRESA